MAFCLFPDTPTLRYPDTGVSMRSGPLDYNWEKLAEELEITLPKNFLRMLTMEPDDRTAWKFLAPADATSLKAELDLRFDYPGREWRGIPFARSLVSEDIACFDLRTPPGDEARVLPIRDWHGPRWEFSGETKTFVQWLSQNREGHLT